VIGAGRWRRAAGSHFALDRDVFEVGGGLCWQARPEPVECLRRFGIERPFTRAGPVTVLASIRHVFSRRSISTKRPGLVGHSTLPHCRVSHQSTNQWTCRSVGPSRRLCTGWVVRVRPAGPGLLVEVDVGLGRNPATCGTSCVYIVAATAFECPGRNCGSVGGQTVLRLLRGVIPQRYLACRYLAPFFCCDGGFWAGLQPVVEALNLPFWHTVVIPLWLGEGPCRLAG